MKRRLLPIGALCAGLALFLASRGAHGGPNLNFGPAFSLTGQFNRPFGLALDPTNGAANLLVADTANHALKWAPLSGIEGPSGPSSSLAFTSVNVGTPSEPQGVASDGNGNVYVVDTVTNSVQHYAWSGGNYAAVSGFCAHNTQTLNHPRDVVTDAQGAVYVLDSGNNRILKATGPADPNCWSVFTSQPGWSNPYGLGYASPYFYVADTGNQRIVKLSSTGAQVAAIGSFGTLPGQFRYPRDVAVDSNGYLFVADTFNHRIQVLTGTGAFLEALGAPPQIGTLDKIVVDAQDRIFAVDSDNNDIVAFLGASIPSPVDIYLRAFEGDTGSMPRPTGNTTYASPDIVVRNQADIDVATAATTGLDPYQSQNPRYGSPNYVYVGVHNRGTQTAFGSTIMLFWYDPATATQGEYIPFWQTSGIFTAYLGPQNNTQGNVLPAASMAPGGSTVVGPFVWTPPQPNQATQPFTLAVRASNPYDLPPTGNPPTPVLASNNIALAPVTVTQAPYSTGVQNTLVLLVNYPDYPAPTYPQLQANDPGITPHGAALTGWINQASEGQATVDIAYRGPFQALHPSTYYDTQSNTPVVDLTTDTLGQAIAVEPNLLGGGSNPTIGRVIVVTNDPNTDTSAVPAPTPTTINWPYDLASTGAWQYLLSGTPYYLTASVQGINDPDPAYAHGLSHQMGLEDLYAYPNVVLSGPTATGWDNMATPFNGEHPLVWSKELAGWVTAAGGQVPFVPRPATTWSSQSPIGINYQESIQSGQTAAVAFGLTAGVTTFSDETAFYYVEARNQAGLDSVLAGDGGVIMYYVNTLTPQGQGPVIVQDYGGSDAGTLDRAGIPVGGTASPAGTGLSVTVQAGTNGADFNLSATYTPPTTNYDVYFNPGPPTAWWESPDIWIENLPATTTDHGRSENESPIAGENNTLWADVHNHGPAAALNFQIMFSLSEPYHTVDGQASFNEYRSLWVNQLDGGTDMLVSVPWDPLTGITPHVCAQVQAQDLFNDSNPSNNSAQHNFEVDHSEHGSPYTPISFPVMVTNKGTTPNLYYYRADGVPAGWQWSLTPQKALVAPGATATAVFNAQPPPSAADCTSTVISLSGWTPQGDTLVRLGGTALQVDLQQKTSLVFKPGLRECSSKERSEGAFVLANATEQSSALPASETLLQRSSLRHLLVATLPGALAGLDALPAEGMVDEAWPAPPLTAQALGRLPVQMSTAMTSLSSTYASAREGPTCADVAVTGCTQPPRPHQPIIVVYTRPDGSSFENTVQTNAQGCFTDSQPAGEGGDWGVACEYPGNTCQGLAISRGTISVPISVGLIPDPDAPNENHSTCVEPYNVDVTGEITEATKPTFGRCEPLTRASSQRVLLRLSGAKAFSGELEISDFDELTLSDGAGAGEGRFILKSAAITVVGRVVALMGVGTHRAPPSACAEDAPGPTHWEVELDGVVVAESEVAAKKTRLGARFRGTAALDAPKTSHGAPTAAHAVVGTLRASLESDCQPDVQVLAERVVIADLRYLYDLEGPTCKQVGCLQPVAAGGLGTLTQTETEMNTCPFAGTHPFKTWNRLQVQLATQTSRSSILGPGTLQVDQLLTIQTGQPGAKGAGVLGEQFGRFVFTGGEDRIEGELRGLSGAGTHLAPDLLHCDKATDANHWEGRLTGFVSAGPHKGKTVEARYVAEVRPAECRDRRISFSIDGWATTSCGGQTTLAAAAARGSMPAKRRTKARVRKATPVVH